MSNKQAPYRGSYSRCFAHVGSLYLEVPQLALGGKFALLVRRAAGDRMRSTITNVVRFKHGHLSLGY
jgi:hypothetical protein